MAVTHTTHTQTRAKQGPVASWPLTFDPSAFKVLALGLVVQVGVVEQRLVMATHQL